METCNKGADNQIWAFDEDVRLLGGTYKGGEYVPNPELNGSHVLRCGTGNTLGQQQQNARYVNMECPSCRFSTQMPLRFLEEVSLTCKFNTNVSISIDHQLHRAAYKVNPSHLGIIMNGGKYSWELCIKMPHMCDDDLKDWLWTLQDAGGGFVFITTPSGERLSTRGGGITTEAANDSWSQKFKISQGPLLNPKARGMVYITSSEGIKLCYASSGSQKFLEYCKSNDPRDDKPSVFQILTTALADICS